MICDMHKKSKIRPQRRFWLCTYFRAAALRGTCITFRVEGDTDDNDDIRPVLLLELLVWTVNEGICGPISL